MANPVREEIIRRLDLVAEFQKYGGKIPPGAQPSATGWLPVHSVDRPDNVASAGLNVGNDPNVRGIYVDHAPTGKGAMSFFDMIVRLPSSPRMMGKEAYNHYAAQTGVDNGDGKPKAEKIAPTMKDVEGFQADLTPDTVQFLRDKRGLTEDSLKKYLVGWSI